MATNTITFTTTAAQNSKIKAAMEYRRDVADPQNAPHTLSAAQVATEVRVIALGAIRQQVKSYLREKRDVMTPGDNVDDIA